MIRTTVTQSVDFSRYRDIFGYTDETIARRPGDSRKSYKYIELREESMETAEISIMNPWNGEIRAFWIKVLPYRSVSHVPPKNGVCLCDLFNIYC